MDMEKIYTDFTTNMLPKISEGIQLTKDYFMDVFARYVKYLIVTDIMYIVLFTVLAIVSLIAVKNVHTWKDNDGVLRPLPVAIAVALLVFAIAAVCNMFSLVKTIYVPEIRVYEELTSYKQTHP